jgi:ribosome maturation protein Sdo1
MENSSDDDLCRLEENDVAEEAMQDSIEQPSRKQLLEEKSRNIRERLAARRIKPPLSPLKLSEQAMERSIREGRLAMEAMKSSRSSLLRASTSSLRKVLSNTSAIDAMANVKNLM